MSCRLTCLSERIDLWDVNRSYFACVLKTLGSRIFFKKKSVDGGEKVNTDGI